MGTTINIGVLAHVDAGKTSLTERLLHTAGVIDEVGSVDSGDTQTDSLAVERRRGITVRAAVATFTMRGTKVNLIDTPGHADFIAEVERVLGVLDGVIVVVSAVEGVQPQTRLLMRTVAEMGVPALLFVNKVDRRGARCADLVAAISSALSPSVLRMCDVSDLGTPQVAVAPRSFAGTGFAAEAAEVLADVDPGFLQRYVDDQRPVSAAEYWHRVAKRTAVGAMYPVYFGSAVLGVGVGPLLDAVVDLIPASAGTPADDLRGTVFKVERRPTGEKVAYIRVDSGTLAARSPLELHRAGRMSVTARPSRVEVFDRGVCTVPANALPGDIGRVSGLAEARVGDRIGCDDGTRRGRPFAPPGMRTTVKSVDRAEAEALYAALQELTEEDPHINVCRAADGIQVSLYGEVQREVLEVLLAERYGLAVTFSPIEVVCLERPVGTGSALHEFIHRGRNHFWATVGVSVAAGAVGSGVHYQLAVGLGALPLSFYAAIEESVTSTLQQGIYGWEVVDIKVRLTHVGYDAPHSTAGDFRGVTPLVLMQALRRAGTQVLEPVDWFHVDCPIAHTSTVLSTLAAAGATPEAPVFTGDNCAIEGILPAASTQRIRQALPTLTQGEAAMASRPHAHRPTQGQPPRRPRTDANPLNPKEYLLHTTRRV
ncbi:ribosomal protection tetracycline resistance protein [Amycolatopsis sulphurea]|uniref:Ribosomal protection tetracycline resistance protein n=1 Tax=Amycolatopsis sulphurea TaxID=76022 RepID=A0A2A9FET9_9PSEU|nr:TetM/TetW/TetO/TetS family tetracycline resistance ribosomal protection protein [Amycolatopsis sulphurea]PFG49678.1 ribosomal protection tetracycline resistance protein [Amycolatopsis sulphurea]